jgi:hypothetical protein
MNSNKHVSLLLEVTQAVFLVIALSLTICSYSSSLNWIYKTLSTAQTIFSIVAEFYMLFLWKIPFLDFLHIPCIAGEYEIEIEYTYKGGGRKKGLLTINQHFLDIGVSMKTDDEESTSNSLGGARFIEIDGKQSLVYYYFSTPDPLHREVNPNKRGTAILEIDGRKLGNGEYWTDAKTIGAIKITKKRSHVTG